MTVALILLVVAFVLLLLAAFGVGAHGCRSAGWGWRCGYWPPGSCPH